MRVLLVSITTGFGHHATAAALAEGFRSRGCEVVTEDLYEYCSTFMYHAMDKGYLFVSKHMKRPFSLAYDNLESSKTLRSMANVIGGNALIARKFARFFLGFSPDIVISTHVFATNILNGIKKQGLLSVPVIGIVTDYCFHPFWEDFHHIDYMVTASELLNGSALERGIDPKKLLPFGLPIRSCFKTKVPKQEARAALELADRRTVLLVSGSMGYGNMSGIVRQVLRYSGQLQLLCVCGNNKKLQETLSAIHDPRLKVYGFVNNLDLFMDAADCIITKPGGLTVTELLAKRLPAILINPIPGQEDRNADFLMNAGCALRVTPHFSVTEALHTLFTHPERIELMEQCLALVSHPDATDRCCDFAMELMASHAAAAQAKSSALPAANVKKILKKA